MVTSVNVVFVGRTDRKADYGGKQGQPGAGSNQFSARCLLKKIPDCSDPLVSERRSCAPGMTGRGGGVGGTGGREGACGMLYLEG